MQMIVYVTQLSLNLWLIEKNSRQLICGIKPTLKEKLFIGNYAQSPKKVPKPYFGRLNLVVIRL